MLNNPYTMMPGLCTYGVKVWPSTFELLPAKQRDLNRLP